jgi:hypothetical protein
LYPTAFGQNLLPLLAPPVNLNSPLLSAGLLGPVAVRYAVEAQVP